MIATHFTNSKVFAMTAATSFAQLGVPAPMLRVLEEIGYETPSPIQEQSIPCLMAGKNLLGQAQTGTGKTAAFSIPLLARLDMARESTQLLVLTPTRELALQVAEAMQKYARYMKGFHIVPIYGGENMGTQVRQLKRGAHVVVGTPGRVMDHMRRGTLVLDDLSAMVLDEADEMLKMGFIDDVEWILEQTPDTRQVALFSATMPQAIRTVAQRYLKDAEEIQIKAKTATVDRIRQRYWSVHHDHKLDALTRILEVEEYDAAILFVRTKVQCEELAEKLEARGHATAPLHGDMNQKQRETTISRLKAGKVDVVVATDVAARGLDVERISLVVNYDVPYDTEAYVHRIGRTGRAGRTGDAILFVTPREMRMLRMIEQACRTKIEQLQFPTVQDVTAQRIKQFTDKLMATLEHVDLDLYQQVVEGICHDHELGIERVAAALTYLAQKSRPFKVKEQAALERPAAMAREGGRERGERGERTERRERPARGPVEQGMQRYRLAVGRDHGISPKDIVGAIANEANLDSRMIGRIDLHRGYSTVDLPENLPKELLQHLRKVRVRGVPMELALDSGGRDGGGRDSGGRDGNAPPRKPKVGHRGKAK